MKYQDYVERARELSERPGILCAEGTKFPDELIPHFEVSPVILLGDTGVVWKYVLLKQSKARLINLNYKWFALCYDEETLFIQVRSAMYPHDGHDVLYVTDDPPEFILL